MTRMNGKDLGLRLIAALEIPSTPRSPSTQRILDCLMSRVNVIGTGSD